MMDSFKKFVPVRTMLPRGFCPEQKHLAWKFSFTQQTKKTICDGLKGKEKNQV